tara:strand:+ start:4540 stop:4830 length:291 start_codon:yes stop_codon:yes gene_type:complete
MGIKKPKKKTNYKVGDLVKLNEYGILFELTEGQASIGIIASEPYMFMKTICESSTLDDTALMQLEDWCYDILLGDELVEMMPEDFLDLITEKDEEE